DQLFEVDGIGILAGPARNLEHDGSFFFFAGLDDGLKQLHIVNVESPEGVLAFECFGEELFGMCQWHIQLYETKICGNKPRIAGECSERFVEKKIKSVAKLPPKMPQTAEMRLAI